MEKTTLTDEEKYNFMKMEGVTVMEGWLFDIETPEECYMNTFISKEEVFTKIKEGMKRYYYWKNMEAICDFEEMWEYIEEDKWDEWEIEETTLGYELFDSTVRQYLNAKNGRN